MNLALGTVQFGLPYGIAGRAEPVSESEVRAILEDAAGRGVRTLDTAAGYGDIEPRLGYLSRGLPLCIVSKVPAIPDALNPDAAAAFALQAARNSRERLGGGLRSLMLHRAADLIGLRGDAVWAALSDWSHDEGVLIGASCYGPNELGGLTARYPLALAQLPGNAFDQRLDHGPAKSQLGAVEIHLRSAFLQGLLLMPFDLAITRLPRARLQLQRWHEWCSTRNLTPLRAALSVVKSFSMVSTVVVGVDSLVQWVEIAEAWHDTRAMNAAELACDEADLIDPRLWKLQA